jgi:hypothetical protein
MSAMATSLVQCRGPGRLDNHAIELPLADRLRRVLVWEQAAVAMHHACCRPTFHHWRSSTRSLSTSATFSINTSATCRPHHT